MNSAPRFNWLVPIGIIVLAFLLGLANNLRVPAESKVPLFTSATEGGAQ